MRDLTNALLRLSWSVPLTGAEQLTKIFSRPLTTALGTKPGSLGAAASVVEEQVGKLFQATREGADDLQRQTVDCVYEGLTLKPVVAALQQNFSFLGPRPEPGAQEQPELAYLKAVNDAGPPGQSLTILFPGVLYSNLNRAAEGVEIYQGYLRDFDAAMLPWQRGVYLSTLALLRASAAQVTPIWDVVDLLALARGALSAAREAKEVTAGLPDYDSQTAKVIAVWVSGLLNAQLPAPLGDKKLARQDLEWVAATINRTPESQANSFLYLRECYFQLALLARGAGDTTKAQEYLQLSTYDDFEKPNIILATLFAVDEQGLRDGIKHCLVSGNGSVFTVSGHDMSEFNYCISEDGKELIAIDAGTRWQRSEAAYNYFVGYLRSLGREPPPLTTVFFTHAHWDHIGGHTTYRKLNPNVKFYSRSNYREEQRRIVDLPPPYDWFLSTEFEIGDVASYRPDVVIEAGHEELTIGGTKVEIKLIPGGGGETPDGLFIHLPKEKVLFAGDFIVPWIGSPYNQEGDIDSLLEAIDWIAEIRPDIVLHGHEALTVFLKRWQAMERLRVHLAWLRAKTEELIDAHHSRVEIQEQNLYPQAILKADQADIQLVYLLLRESVINRIYHSRTGYWGPQLENVDYLTAAEFGSIFKRYLKLTSSEIVDLVDAMLRNGDHELAGKLADWCLTQDNNDDRLREAQKKAYRKLKEKWQVLNVFKFIMYAEHIDDPTHQLPLGETPQGYAEEAAEPFIDLGFSNASFAGNYGFSLVVGGQRVVGIGVTQSDGNGNFYGSQELNLGTGAELVFQTVNGTYQVYPDGTGVAHLTLTLPDGTEVPQTFDYVVLRAEQRGDVKLAIELQGVGRDPVVDPATGQPFDPPQIGVSWFERRP